MKETETTDAPGEMPTQDAPESDAAFTDVDWGEVTAKVHPLARFEGKTIGILAVAAEPSNDATVEGETEPVSIPAGYAAKLRAQFHSRPGQRVRIRVKVTAGKRGRYVFTPAS